MAVAQMRGVARRQESTPAAACPGGFRQLSSALGALSRVERSVEAGSAAWAISTASRDGTASGLKSLSDFAERAHRPSGVGQRMVVGNRESPPGSDAGRVAIRSRESLDAERAASAGAGLLASARMAASLRAVIAPANLSQREFAEPSGNARGHEQQQCARGYHYQLVADGRDQRGGGGR